MRNTTLKLLGALALTLVVSPAFVTAAHAQEDQAEPQEQAAPKITLKVGDEAPEISVDGWWMEKAPEKRAKGKVYIVDFWASWCGPCRESMPHMAEMQDKYGDYATFIGISIDQDKGAAADYLSSLGQDLPIYFAMDKDDQSWQSWGNAAGRTTIPTTFIVDENNKIAWVGHPMEVEAKLRDIILKKLAK